MTCCTHRCKQGRDCANRRCLLNAAWALVGYGVFLGLLMCAVMAAASWLALAVPHGGA